MNLQAGRTVFQTLTWGVLSLIAGAFLLCFYEQCPQLDPQAWREVHHENNRYLSEIRKWTRHFDRLLEKAPKSPLLLRQGIERHLLSFKATGEHEHLHVAASYASRWHEHDPEDIRALTLYSHTLGMLHRFDEALSLAERAYLKSPSGYTAAFVFDAAIELGHGELAQAMIRKLRADTYPGSVRLARWHASHGELETALHLYEFAYLKASKGSVHPVYLSSILANHGQVLLEKGYARQASDYFLKSLRTYAQQSLAIQGLEAIVAKKS